MENASLKANGLDIGEFTFDPGLGLTVAVGSTLFEGRVEVEAGYRISDAVFKEIAGAGTTVPSGETTIITLMGNSYYDIPAVGNILPFFGVGVGIANIEFQLDTGVDASTAIAYQAMLGAGYPLAEKIIIDIQYRFFGTSDATLRAGGSDVKSRNSAHNLMIGFRYKF